MDQIGLRRVLIPSLELSGVTCPQAKMFAYSGTVQRKIGIGKPCYLAQNGTGIIMAYKSK